MYTVKLFYSPEEYNVFEVPHYHVSRYPSSEGEVIEITLYKDYTSQDGLTYKIANDLQEPHWSYAYIQNSAGKTIEGLKPKN